MSWFSYLRHAWSLLGGCIHLPGCRSKVHKATELGWSLRRGSVSWWKPTVTKVMTGSRRGFRRLFIELYVNSNSLRHGEASPFYRWRIWVYLLGSYQLLLTKTPVQIGLIVRHLKSHNQPRENWLILSWEHFPNPIKQRGKEPKFWSPTVGLNPDFTTCCYVTLHRLQEFFRSQFLNLWNSDKKIPTWD